MMSEKAGRVGTSFGDFLKEEGVYDKMTASAVKRLLARQLQQAMAQQQMSKSQLARAMKTSLSQLDRLFDPDNDRSQQDPFIKAARVLGREVRIDLV